MSRYSVRCHRTYVLLFLMIISECLFLAWCNISGNKLPTSGPVVETKYGPVQGVYLESDGARAFYGVPFAAPPIDNLRWEPPREPDSWGPEEWMATENPPGCPQICEGINPPIDCPDETSEDCLYMNIFTPFEASSSSNLPVMIYIHGGGFTVNSAASPLFDGRYLAAMTTSIVVVANYRLGALGFLVSGEKPNTDANFDYLGYGIQDQRQAMTFVQENIAGFGGNPNKVSLAGNSVGAQSVALHLSSNKSDSLFQQAIMQSPPFSLPFATLKEADRLSKLVADYVQCGVEDITCLRSKSAEEIVMAQNYAADQTFKWINNIQLAFQPWGPVHANPLEDFAAGNFQKKPIILGSLSDEARWSVFSLLPNEVPKIISVPAYFVLFGIKNSLKVILKYPLNSTPDVRDTLSEVMGDYIWTCSVRRATRDIESFETVPIYHYLFDHPVNDSAVWGFIEDWCRDSSCHTGDLFFLFYTLPLEGFSYTDEEKMLAKSMIRYWGNFVHTGDPNIDSWREEKAQLFQSSKRSSILKHLNTSHSTITSSEILRKLKREFDADVMWPPYTAQKQWPSLWIKTPKYGILHRYKAKYCRMWDNIG